MAKAKNEKQQGKGVYLLSIRHLRGRGPLVHRVVILGMGSASQEVLLLRAELPVVTSVSLPFLSGDAGWRPTLLRHHGDFQAVSKSSKVCNGLWLRFGRVS